MGDLKDSRADRFGIKIKDEVNIVGIRRSSKVKYFNVNIACCINVRKEDIDIFSLVVIIGYNDVAGVGSFAVKDLAPNTN